VRGFFSVFSIVLFALGALSLLLGFSDLPSDRGIFMIGSAIGVMIAAGILRMLTEIAGKLADISQVLDDDIAEALQGSNIEIAAVRAEVPQAPQRKVTALGALRERAAELRGR
jgi:hypothetical protein